ncbi:hypothetical protein ACAW74_26975 [Fibrella sp. WM1]|uniref:hypothetical protein n=1 Tax=Fibrella musci TaxID=3242485 RepID=UPI00351FCC5A
MRFVRKPWLGLLWLCLGLAATPLFAQTPPFSYTSDVRDTLGRMREDEERRLMDPALGRVPYERLAAERERLIKAQKLGTLPTQAAIPGITWQERGPSNAGGRTRALLFDPNDPAKKKVWAASPAGGLWYTNDITDVNASWTPVSDTWENTVVTALAADPSNPQVMYAGTGNLVSFEQTVGGGIWKTTNGGVTWVRINSTVPTTTAAPSLGQAFRYIHRIVVNSVGVVFAATQSGVIRSTDGGSSWSYVLAPNQGIGYGTNTGSYWYDSVLDLELATDGILYASFAPTRLFKSTDGTGMAWTEITPTNVPAGGEHTELALASSTSGSSQVIYAVTKDYNNTTYSNDIKWFCRSTNGGSTWTNVTIPTQSWGYHFTLGNGHTALSLIVDPANPNLLLAGGYNLFRSADGGATWSTALDINYEYQQAFAFQPNSKGVAFATQNGVRWSGSLGDAAVVAPSVTRRNANYRVSEIRSVAMKEIAGGDYVFSSTDKNGYIKMNGPGLTEGILVAGGSSGMTFIDKDQPTVQLFNSYGTYFLYDGTSVTSLFSGYYGADPNPADYDSQTNTLYLYEYANNAYSVRRVTGIGSSATTTTYIPLPGVNYVASYIKLGTNNASLFVSAYASETIKLFRITNLNQSTPTVTMLNTSSLPLYTTVSSIDVGSSDNDILLTLSNYGVVSVWFSNDGGSTWTSKDPAGSGLPDVPVYAGIFNPQNRQQVLLGTAIGVWTTNSFFDPNPSWGVSNSGMPLAGVNRFTYRLSDGRLLAATRGRGIYETNAFAIPYTPSSIALTSVSNTTLCAGSPLSVSFTTSGPDFTGTINYEVWISDANGSFTNQKRIGTGTSSPVSMTLPTGANGLPYGTKYLVRVVAAELSLTSSASSQTLTIGNLSSASIQPVRLADFVQYNSSASICPGDQIRLTVSGNPIADGYLWSYNGTLLTGATSGTFLAGSSGNYTVQVRQAGCIATSSAYSVYSSSSPYIYITTKFGNRPQCDDEPVAMYSSYYGEQASSQWIRNGTSVTNANSYSYATKSSGSYTLAIALPGCTPYMTPFKLTVGRSLWASLSRDPQKDSVLCTGPATGLVRILISDINNFPIGVSGGYTIDWYRDNKPLTNVQNAHSISVNEPGSYTYELRQGSCTTRSNAITVRQGTVVPPVIDFYSAKNACPGSVRTLYFFGAYTAYPSWQWQKDGVDIPGATGSSYTAQTSGSYTIRGAKGSCMAVSEPISLTFSTNIIPVVINQSKDVSCSNIWLDASAYADLPGTQFRWFKNGVLLATQTGTMLDAYQSGLYSVSITSGSCSGLSQPVKIDPYTLPKTLISVYGNLAVCTANSVKLYASEASTNIQWKRNGVAISGANATYFYPEESGYYSVSFSSYCGTGESESVDVRIGEPTAATITGNALIGSGQTATLPIQLSGPAPWSFTLSNGQTVQNTYLNPHPVSVTATNTTTYSVVNVQNACGTGTSAGQATVTVGSGNADLWLSSLVSSRTPRLGEVVSYSLVVTNEGPQAANGVTISSRLPTGVEFVAAEVGNVSTTNGLVTASVGSVAPSGSQTVSYQLRITQPGTFFTTAQVATTSTPDPDSQPNSGTGDGQDDQTTVDLRTADAAGGLLASANPDQVPLPTTQSNQPAPQAGKVELSLDVRSSMLSAPAGQPQNLSVVVNNRGAVAATNVVVQMLLPTGWSLTNSTGFLVDGQTVRGYVNQLAAGTSAVLVLPVQVNASGVVQAQIQAVNEPVSNASPGNGFTNGERDEANLQIRVK